MEDSELTDKEKMLFYKSTEAVLNKLKEDFEKWFNHYRKRSDEHKDAVERVALEGISNGLLMAHDHVKKMMYSNQNARMDLLESVIEKKNEEG